MSSSQVTFFNIVPSPRDDRDMNVDMIFELPLNYPRNLDWSSHLNDVRNQGVQGTSLTQAGVCMLEWRDRKLNKERKTYSPQFLYNNRENQKNTFMCGRELMNHLKTIGCCTEDACQYGKEELNTNIMTDEANQTKINGYARVQTIETLKMALYVFGPALITFPVFNHTSYMWKQHKHEEKLGGHAMTVVGYNTKGFILRNSWGKYWENQGYCIYPYEDWGYHDEVWSIADQGSYDTWKEKPKNAVTKMIKRNLSTKSTIVRNSVDRASGTFILPNMTPLPSARTAESSSVDPDTITYETSFKDKSAIQNESNSMKKKGGFFSLFFVSNKESKKSAEKKKQPIKKKKKKPKKPVEEEEEEEEEEEAEAEPEAEAAPEN